MPATSPIAYRSRPLELVIRDASPVSFMLPVSTMTTGTVDMFRVPRSVRLAAPGVDLELALARADAPTLLRQAAGAADVHPPISPDSAGRMTRDRGSGTDRWG